MSKRKNINDLLSNDRDIVRSAQSYTGDFFKDDFGYKKGGGNGGGGSGFQRCYTKHPPLKLPGTDMVIYGGSCSDPVVVDADVYIGFDHSMRWTERHYPWKKGDEIYFRIQDMGAPQKPEEFEKLVNWTIDQLKAGRKVHCGCIGGHGRTGTFLAALVSKFGEVDAVSYVRQNYCQKAVESQSQIEFLHQHFGITKVAGTKGSGSKSYGKSGSHSSSVVPYKGDTSRGGVKKATAKTYGYLKGGGSIWE